MHSVRRLPSAASEAVQRLRDRRRGPLYWLGTTRVSDPASGDPSASAGPFPTAGKHEPRSCESRPCAAAPLPCAQPGQEEGLP